MKFKQSRPRNQKMTERGKMSAVDCTAMDLTQMPDQNLSFKMHKQIFDDTGSMWVRSQLSTKYCTCWLICSTPSIPSASCHVKYMRLREYNGLCVDATTQLSAEDSLADTAPSSSSTLSYIPCKQAVFHVRRSASDKLYFSITC